MFKEETGSSLNATYDKFNIIDNIIADLLAAMKVRISSLKNKTETLERRCTANDIVIDVFAQI